MSDVMLLLAHPRAASYCHALAENIAERLVELGHQVRSHDLYAERFDPILASYESHISGELISRC
ncbi:NAD(P)H-dependent oxidoreductase [Aeromicrobium sp. UC242_57]|uniref:NAD(P)H-dependent oxidoreductase n=1 Tax=Aeromicrobium sp. UC242_57 TaxID=3374624 RepID=UPI0037A0E1D2